MIVLGFDTATPATAVALRFDGGCVQARDDPRPGERPGHATRLLGLAAELLAQAGLGWADIDRIAIGVGPGRFTGLRIGVASARGLAQSLGIELVGVSSLLALAGAASGSAQEDQGILAVIDARRGEVFAAAYAPAERSVTRNGAAVRRDGAGFPRDGAGFPHEGAGLRGQGSEAPRELLAPRALAPADLGDVLDEASAAPGGETVARWLAVGDGAVLYSRETQALGVRSPDDGSPLHRVSAEAICELAVSRAAQAIETVLPDYRRRPDAQSVAERAGASAYGAGARA